MGRGEGPVYGYIQLPCKVELQCACGGPNLADFSGLEFTGERVVPGLVDADLLNEHLARYRFAARSARSSGRAQRCSMRDADRVTEARNSAQLRALSASTFRRRRWPMRRASFRGPGFIFCRVAATALPFADGSFDLVAAFEVIEHLERWEEMLSEARRVLRPSGVLLVSTPNKAYYAEARGAAGPNPFHVHEFEYGEFAAALQSGVSARAFVELRTTRKRSCSFPRRRAFAGGDLDAPGEPASRNTRISSSPPAASRRSRDQRAFAWLPAVGQCSSRTRTPHRAARNRSGAEERLAARARQHQTNYAESQQSHEGRTEWADRLDAS